MTKLAWAIFWFVLALGWLRVAAFPQGAEWLIPVGLTLVALWCFGQAMHWFVRWLFAGEERVEMLECDCSAADKCPQGKGGEAGKCSIWKNIE